MFVVIFVFLRYVKLKIAVMKKYLFLFVLLLASFSCSSDNDDDKVDTKIVGKWVSVAFDTGDGWTYAITPSYWIFKSDNTFETDYANYKQGTYTFSGNVLTLNGGFGEKVTFSENGQQMEWGKWRYKRQ